ncbi:peptidylprolyl isomerase [Rhizobium halophytocola]|uniref:Parvulin-like PPIase n=1 Tax=Rhizobium halophytocola TaxID=735519 RepID=A0ABS4DWE7_9HYPH|nr:peptidylprolyl isomerase [Rhizobium halophytocola]MBP1850012.1 peptidyl-prolyl cis-trans isomerase D [Rhizobium halophytocola]
MLDSLRNAAQTWVAKLLLLLLVASFGVWGVSRSLVSGQADTVMTVGDQQISSNEFRFAYQRRLDALSQQFGTRLTTEQARAFGVVNQVYAELSAGASLDQLADEMHLGLSQDRLAQLIAEDPAFKGSNGRFDRQLFASRLANSGIRQEDYIKERSDVAVRSQVVEAISDGFKPPKVLVDAMTKYSTESRDIDYLLLTNANIDPIPAPSDEVLKKWFDTVKSRYRAPEYRSFSYVKLEPADIAHPGDITDQQIADEYAARKKSFEIAGTRTIEQLTFADKAAADAAAAKLSSGTSFDQLVTDTGKTPTDVLLGDFSHDNMPDQTLADAAFAVDKDGGTTPVIDGAFGPVILRVTNIKPTRVKSLDEVKDEIRQQLATTAAADDILSVHDNFEDLRASGATLEDVARQLKLNVVKIPAIDSQGQDRDGKAIDVPQGKTLVTQVFQADVGSETQPLSIGADGFLWFDVTNIEEARDRSLDEVHDQAVKDWTTEQQRTALGAKAESLKARLQKGDKLADIAGELKIAVETKAGLKRGAQDSVLGPAAIAAAFSGPVGTAGSAPGGDPSTQIVLSVTHVDDTPSADVLENDNRQVTALANAAGDDILDQMVQKLQSQYGVSINQQLAEQAMVR